MLVVFDIDGTIANIDHRLDYVQTKPKNWRAFEAGIPFDVVNEPVATVYMQMVNSGHQVVLASGRSETSRQATIDWFKANNLFVAKLYMRKEKDYRSDVVVKQEILNEIIKDYGCKPDMVFDDRPGVVQMWRNNGIFVFDCYQKKEIF